MVRALDQIFGEENSMPLNSGITLVEVYGRKRVLIENHRGIIAYGDSRVLINGNCGCVEIKGANLQLRNMSKTNLLITGKVTSVCFQEDS